jgi:hypothetical protein
MECGKTIQNLGRADNGKDGVQYVLISVNYVVWI